jgi:small neutral amino acid transporter SnatA (MarC family)
MFEYHWFTDFVYLATVLNPFSLVPVFLHVTQHLQRVAMRMGCMASWSDESVL